MFPVKHICLLPGSRCGDALEAVGLSALLAWFLDKAGSLSRAAQVAQGCVAFCLGRAAFREASVAVQHGGWAKRLVDSRDLSDLRPIQLRTLGSLAAHCNVTTEMLHQDFRQNCRHDSDTAGCCCGSVPRRAGLGTA